MATTEAPAKKMAKAKTRPAKATTKGGAKAKAKGGRSKKPAS